MRSTRLVVLGAAALVAVGCGSSSGLSTAAFASQANTVCRSVDATVKAVPKPSPSDLASLVPYAQGIESAYETYLSQVTALAAKAKDRTAIQHGWTDLANADLTAEKPLLAALVAAAQKRDAAATQTAAAALSKATDHTAAIQAYQAKIGATDCSALLTDIAG